ncbi:YIP1 family protein [Candidatus Bathyarchaeota archaeon]|nr:YIP1 family protein [Candidatus Bathyarchaeota archaeon]
MNDAPLIVSSYPASYVENVTQPTHFWGRIVFGVPNLVEGGMAYFWIFVTAWMAVIAFMIYFKPKKQKHLSRWILLLAILSIPIGAGFYIGAIFAAIVGLYGLELPKPFGETFVGRIISSLRLKSKFFENLVKDSKGLQIAVVTLIIVGLAAGIGNSLYTTNLYKIKAKSPYDPEAVANVFLRGVLYTDITVYTTSISFIAIEIFKWIMLSVIVYVLAVKLADRELTFSQTSTVMAYAFVPEIILFFMPAVFMNEPNLSETWQYLIFPVSWPLVLFYITHLWGFVIMFIALRATFDISTGKAFGAALLAGVPYFLVYYMLIIPTLTLTGAPFPGVQIVFAGQSSSMLLLLGSIGLALAVFLGALRKE